MQSPAFSLAIIRSVDTKAALAFYNALGLTFVEEQHGSGPIHYSCELGSIVLEIYPGQAGSAPEPRVSGATMLGFKVISLEETLTALSILGVEPKNTPKEAEWGRWVNVTDPDGRVIQLTQPLD